MAVFYRIIGVCAATLVVAIVVWASHADGAQRSGPAQQPASCRDSKLRWPEQAGTDNSLGIEVDVNGDGLIDLLQAESSCGSGTCNKSVRVILAGSGVKIEASTEFSFTSIVAIDPVPRELIDAGNRDALAWVEEALFPKVCTTPDPSLAWLLAPQKRLSWIAGSPQMPTHYAMRVLARSVAGLPNMANRAGEKIEADGEVWLFYAGGVHTMNAFELVELATKGERVLLGSAHGVILTNPERSKHAWIYVYPGNGESKLRFPSMAGARFQGDTAIIAIRYLDVDGPPQLRGRKEAKPLQVRIDLKTGAILK